MKCHFEYKSGEKGKAICLWVNEIRRHRITIYQAIFHTNVSNKWWLPNTYFKCIIYITEWIAYQILLVQLNVLITSYWFLLFDLYYSLQDFIKHYIVKNETFSKSPTNNTQHTHRASSLTFFKLYFYIAKSIKLWFPREYLIMLNKYSVLLS